MRTIRAGARHRRFRSDYRARDSQRYMPAELSNGDLASETLRLAHDNGIALLSEGLAGIGYLNNAVFRLGEETYIGRQHLPLIRAQLQNAKT